MTDREDLSISRQISAQTIMQGIQTVVLLGSVAGVFMAVGRRDNTIETHGERIKELAQISSDLASAVSSLSATDREHAERLSGIQFRLSQLERN